MVLEIDSCENVIQRSLQFGSERWGREGPPNKSMEVFSVLPDDAGYGNNKASKGKKATLIRRGHVDRPEGAAPVDTERKNILGRENSKCGRLWGGSC